MNADLADCTRIKQKNLNADYVDPEAEPSVRFGASNYSYELLISSNVHFSPPTSNLEDFGVTSSLPLPKFDGSTISLSLEITKCPTTSTIYYFALFLKDNLDEENKSNFATSSTTLSEDLCSPGESILVQNIYTTTTSTGKILFSEIYIKEGTSTGEFIELYNPNEFDIDLTGWEIRKINRNGKEQTIIPSSKFKGIIPSFSYFLLVNANTSSEITTNPDFIYPKSYDLAKDNGLILIDKENKIIDQVCWGNPKDFQNCISNPTSTSFSLQRKKTATSTSETIINQNLGNAYSTNNSSNDFLYAPINPENSSITRPTIKAIQNFQVTNQGKIYNFTWLSPAYYDENLSYELSISTSSFSTFQTIASTTFKILENQFLSLNLCNLNITSGTDLYFRLNLLNDNQILKTASTSAKMIDCNDFNLNFILLEDKTFSENRLIGNDVYVATVGKTWKYKLLDNISLKKIRIDFWVICGFFTCSNPFYQLSFKLMKIIPNSSSAIVLFDSASHSGLKTDYLPFVIRNYAALIVEPEEPIVLSSEDQILIDVRSYDLNFPQKPVFEGEVLP